MICATLLTGLVLAHAESISLEDVLLKPGETVSVGIKLTNSRTDLVSFQMDVYLPEGISVNKTSTLTSRFSSGELSIGRQSDGSHLVLAEPHHGHGGRPGEPVADSIGRRRGG